MTRLLVPMHVHAMVLTAKVKDATSFARTLPDYGKLATLDPVWTPFSSSEDPVPGVHLHWTLPPALRHGSAQDDTRPTSPDWPLVPSRWLVVRLQHETGGIKAWLIASEHPPAGPGEGSPYVAGPGAPQPTRIGRCQVFTPDLIALPQAGAVPLRAIAPGSAEFSVYAPAAVGVFGLHDDMTGPDGTTPLGTTPLGKATLTYHVTGWYASPGDDPLSHTEVPDPANPPAMLPAWAPDPDPDHPGRFVHRELGFLVYAGEQDPPSAMLVHALVKGVQWNPGDSIPPGVNQPADISATVRVAVGNTALDALAAIVRLPRDGIGQDDAQAEADFLEAFGHGLLDQFDQPASTTLLDMAIRRDWFDSSSGGSAYTVTGRDGSAPPPLSPARQQALAGLNAAQRERDRQARVLAAMRWQLQALWWKKGWAAAGRRRLDDVLWMGTDAQLVPQLKNQLESHTAHAAAGQPPTYLDQVNAQAATLSDCDRAVKTAVDALTTALGPGLLVRELALPGFHVPGDPVLVVTGLGRSTILDPADPPVCRLPAQLLDGPDPPPLDDPHGLLPDAVQGLHREAAAIARGMRSDTEPAVGARFPPVSYAREDWAQPWVPLVLEWTVRVIGTPDYAPVQGDPALPHWTAGNWTFDGTDYQPLPAACDRGQVAGDGPVLTGRTLLTPQTSLTLAAQLRDWLATHAARGAWPAGLADLEAFLDKLSRQDILCQRLSGLRALLIQRDYATSATPAGPVGDALGLTDPDAARPRGTPRPAGERTRPALTFLPLAGTFFTIERLRVTDFMGRTSDLLLANQSSSPRIARDDQAAYFFPIAGRGLRSPGMLDPPQADKADSLADQMLQLPPRLAQDAQVSFRLITADDRCQDISCVPGGDPVCGWVVPNHLDRSLAFYSPDGRPWGELRLAGHGDGSYTVTWDKDPVDPGAPAKVTDIPNQYVARWLKALTAKAISGQQAPGDRFANVLAAIDETLRNIDPRGARKDQALSVLVGRPLAIVRAELSLRVAGLFATSQDWWSTFRLPPVPGSAAAPLGAADGGIAGYRWRVRLGDAALRDDGLIGYFADPPSTATGGGPAQDEIAGFARMAAVHPPADATGYVISAMDPSAQPSLHLIDDSVAAPDPELGQVVRLTMLLDPRAGVHAFTGLLPVETLPLPPELYLPALRTLAYRFRAGPLLMPAGRQARIPRPSERKGTWTWFDPVTRTQLAIVPEDGKPRLASDPPVIREGWLTLQPADGSEESLWPAGPVQRDQDQDNQEDHRDERTNPRLRLPAVRSHSSLGLHRSDGHDFLRARPAPGILSDHDQDPGWRPRRRRVAVGQCAAGPGPRHCLGRGRCRRRRRCVSGDDQAVRRRQHVHRHFPDQLHDARHPGQPAGRRGAHRRHRDHRHGRGRLGRDWYLRPHQIQSHR